MKTVILKWNPSFSSYSMLDYLYEMQQLNKGRDVQFNWSIWDHDQVKEGDRFYWVKVGMYGQIGIVGCGTIASDCYPGEDWSGKGRETYYADLNPEVLINPDTLPILTAATLSARIPSFEWDRGHSGLVLTDEQAEELDKLWKEFLEENRDALERAASRKWGSHDQIYWEGK